MINRKKKLRIIQFGFLIASVIVMYFTYSDQNKSNNKIIISEKEQKKLEEQLADQSQAGDIFYNISYSGIDFSGNRYVLNAKEAKNDKQNSEIIHLKKVDAIFYMKNETVLKVFSEEGKYNNKTLDVLFKKKVQAYYDDSELFAEKAEFSNSKSFLTISEKVRINDDNGTLYADKLFFDIKKQNLNIVAFDKNKINANINLK